MNVKKEEKLLFSLYFNNAREEALASLKSSGRILDFISERIIDVIVKERVIAEGWFAALKHGWIGSKVIAYDYYVTYNIEGLSDEQITCLNTYWHGFTSGTNYRCFFK